MNQGMRRYARVQEFPEMQRAAITKHDKDNARDRARYAVEKHSGPIPADHDVHHIDGDVFNNDLPNLRVVSLESHLELHEDEPAASLIRGRIERSHARTVE